MKENESIRLNKYLANAGLCSRREADTHIAMGLVQVNGKTITEMGFKVQRTDEVKYDGRRIQSAAPMYILLNKPKGFVATTQGGKMNKTAQELIREATPSKLPAVGDMGRPVTGLLLFTNDETLRIKLNAASALHMLYNIVLDKNVETAAMERLKSGVEWQGKQYRVKAISHVRGGTKREIGVEVNAIPPGMLMKIFDKLNYKILQLDRVLLGGLTKRDLPRGQWRHLTSREISFLKMVQ